METINIVNKFCAFNSFLPTELYTIGLGQVIVKYDESENIEFDSFLLALDRLAIKNIVGYSVVSWDNMTIRITEADW